MTLPTNPTPSNTDIIDVPVDELKTAQSTPATIDGAVTLLSHNHRPPAGVAISYNDLVDKPAGLQIYTGIVTISNDDNIVITCGFVPKLIKVTAYAAGSNAGFSIGHSSGVGTDHCVSRYYSSTWYTNDPSEATGYCFKVFADGSVHAYKGAVSAFGTNSITIDVTKEGDGVTTKLFYEIFG